MSMSAGEWAHSGPGIVFGIGGATALIALIVGGSMIGPNFQKIIDIQQAAEASGGPPSDVALEQIVRARGRIGFGSNVVFVSLIITVIAMAVGRYM
jgi:hypothetical protein